MWRLLRRAGVEANHKRVYRVMKAHGLLLQHHAGGAEARRHDGRVAVERSNLRWCSDGFEIGCAPGPPAVQRVFELTGMSERVPFIR